MRADDEKARRRRIVFSAIVLGLVALGFYVAFIVMTLVRGSPQ